MAKHYRRRRYGSRLRRRRLRLSLSRLLRPDFVDRMVASSDFQQPWRRYRLQRVLGIRCTPGLRYWFRKL